MRRRAAGRRCLAGRRSADRGELLHRARAGRRGRAGPEQDRPADGRPGRAKSEIEDVIGIDARTPCNASAKTGLGVDDVLEAAIAKVPPPKGDPDAPAGADHRLLVRQLSRRRDAGAGHAWHDAARGQDPADGARPQHLVRERRRVHAQVGRRGKPWRPGEVGCIIAGIKELKAAPVGDTVTLAESPAAAPLPGFKEMQPQVFAGLFPVEANQYDALRDALEKLKLNDAALHVRARSLAGAGLRLPLRLPRPAAHGNRAGTAGARVSTWT